jgi:hypothetical protein
MTYIDISQARGGTLKRVTQTLIKAEAWALLKRAAPHCLDIAVIVLRNAVPSTLLGSKATQPSLEVWIRSNCYRFCFDRLWTQNTAIGPLEPSKNGAAVVSITAAREHSRARKEPSMKCLCIYNHPDGTSYLADAQWQAHLGDFTPPSPAGYSTTEALASKSVLMMHHPAGYKDEWHRAPAPVLATVLRGSITIVTSDGDSRTLDPGAQFVAADLQGKGHKIEEVNGAEYDLALVVLDTPPTSRDLVPQ